MMNEIVERSNHVRARVRCRLPARAASVWRREWPRRAAVAVALAAALMAPSIVQAQGPVAPPRPDPIEVQATSPATRPGLRVFGNVDLNHMAASQTFQAVLGTRDLIGFGGGVDVLRLWHSAFARVAVSRISADGTRVIVFGDEVSPVGVATSIKMMPVELSGGWRFGRRGRRLAAYGGGGFVRLAYEETTEFDEPGEDTSATFNGSLVFGGVDVHLTGALAFGAEVQHRRLADAIGQAGASAAFGENDLGGLTLRVWIGIGR